MKLFALPPAPLTLVQLLEDMAGGMRLPDGHSDSGKHYDIPRTEGRGYDGHICTLHLGQQRPAPRLRDEPPWD